MASSAPPTQASSGFIAGLLQSIKPWLTGGSPSALNSTFGQYGGTSGLLDALMQGAGPGTTQAREGAALQRARELAIGNAGQRQQLASRNLGLEFAAARMPLMLAAMRARMGQISGPQPAPAQSSAFPPQAPPGSQSGSPNASTRGAAPISPSLSGSVSFGPPVRTLGIPRARSMPPRMPVSAPSSGRQMLSNAVTDSILGLPWASTELNAAKTAMQYSPAIASQMAAAKNPISQDLAMLYRAYASGDLPLAQALSTKLREDTGNEVVSSWNGMRTFRNPNGSWTSIDPRTGLVTNSQTGVSYLPGAIAAIRARGAAQSVGRAAGELEEVTGPTGTKYWVPKTALLAGEASPGAMPPGSAPATAPNAESGTARGGPVSELGPQREEYLRGTGEEGARQVVQLQNAAQAARSANFQLDQILRDGQNVLTGPTAGVRKWMDTGMAALDQWVGVPPPKSLASYQELDKYANQVAFAASRQLGSREAAQIVRLEQESNPNKSMIPAAFHDLIGAAHAANEYVIAQNEYVQRAAQANGGNPLIASSRWTANADPRVWELAISKPLAAKWAPTLGTSAIARSMPYMLPRTALAAFLNLPRSTQEALVARLPKPFMQDMLSAR